MRETLAGTGPQGHPPIDLIFEATGVATVPFQAMEVLGNDGVLVLLSLTGGAEHESVPIAAINREFVLGNKVLTVGEIRNGVELMRRSDPIAVMRISL